jgi:organic radical activating enzyme
MTHPQLSSGHLLPVMEEFYSLQGEGFHTGSPAWFIRIGGCDVGCEWCDVRESWNADLFPPAETDKVVERALQCPANAVIVTGGEPLLYNLDYLCGQLKAQGTGLRAQGSGHRAQNNKNNFSGNLDSGHLSHRKSKIDNRQSAIIRTFLETSGSRPLTGIWDWICLSPKKEWPPREEFYRIANELKVIIHDEDDLIWAEAQAQQAPDSVHLFLQPEWSRREIMLPRIISYIRTHPEWSLSLQTHKYIGIP